MLISEISLFTIFVVSVISTLCVILRLPKYFSRSFLGIINEKKLFWGLVGRLSAGLITPYVYFPWWFRIYPSSCDNISINWLRVFFSLSKVSCVVVSLGNCHIVSMSYLDGLLFSGWYFYCLFFYSFTYFLYSLLSWVLLTLIIFFVVVCSLLLEFLRFFYHFIISIVICFPLPPPFLSLVSTSVTSY